MNLLGDVTPGSIYSYIDRSLGAWDQRPIFKANIQQFITLRNNSPQISIANLRKIIDIFPNPNEDFPLDPTYEPDKHEVENKCVNREHETTFDLLQDFVKLNLVVPVGEKHMYYAAIHSRSCRLTAQESDVRRDSPWQRLMFSFRTAGTIRITMKLVLC